jgi:NTP pyrophosphatase (non-canonical NTP hydrolase)
MSLPERYEEFVRIGNFTENERDSQFLAAMGLAGEAGEVCDYLKKVLLHGKELDRVKLKDELGDVLWYLQHACNVFDIPMSEIAHGNILKLCKRYPGGYGDSARWYDRPEIPENIPMDSL